MPSSTTRPGPISPTTRPALRTRASVTRCTTARTLLPDLQEGRRRFVRHAQRGAVAQLAAWIETRIEEMPRHDVAERLEHRLLDAGVLLLDIEDQALDALALQAEVTAGRAATADDRQLTLFRVEPRLGFLDVNQWPDHDVLAVVGHQPRRHRLQCAGEKQVEEERLDEVIQVMAEGNLRRADFGGDAVEHAAAQPRAQRARRSVGVEDVVHHVAYRRVLDAVFPPALLAG